MCLNICNITFKRADVSGSEHIPLQPTPCICFSCLGLFFSGTGLEGIFVWLHPFKWKANDCSTWAEKRVHSKHQTIVKQKQPDTHVHHNENWWQTVYILKLGLTAGIRLSAWVISQLFLCLIGSVPKLQSISWAPGELQNVFPWHDPRIMSGHATEWP